MCPTLLVVFVAVQSIALIVLTAAVVICVRKLNRAALELTSSAAEIRNRLLLLADDLRQAARNADELVNSAKIGIDSISRVAVSAERLIEVSRVFSSAEKAITSSRVTLASVLEGLKAGLKALKTQKGKA